MQANQRTWNNLAPFADLRGVGEIVFPEAAARKEARI